MARGRGSRRRWTIVQLVVGLTLLGAAVLAAAPAGLDPAGGRDSRRPDNPLAGFQQSAAGPNIAAAELTSSEYRVTIPALDIDAPLVSVRTDDDGVLGIPRDPMVVGWWQDGAQPGDQTGTAIIAGHANTAAAGAGALVSLSTLNPGDEVTVSGWGSTLRYRIELVQQYRKDALPAAQVFSQDASHVLAIVSCDDLDEETGEYLNNVVAFAVPE